MNDSVTVLPGITKNILKALEKLRITTVGQLASESEFTKNIPCSYKIVSAAKKYLKTNTTTEIEVKDDEETLCEQNSDTINFDNLLNSIVNDSVANPIEIKSETSTPHVEETVALIQDHSWFERKIIIPTEQGTMDPAVIYDLSIDPNNRVAFICSWITNDGNEQVADMTYSPQLIYHYNLDLPTLTIGMSKTDFNSLTNKWTLENIMWETNTMRNSQIL
jgi:hypothetical protein